MRSRRSGTRRCDGAPPLPDAIRSSLPPNKMPAALGASACALDAAVHAWDIAVATGQPSPLTPELASDLLGAARQFVEPLRAFAFAPVVPAEPGDDAVAELLKYLGRRPDWAA
ncbi:hypothetical protein OG883_01955 [Streptomyces sp. NBC_01142]|uniref:hypothetical protein n=1 Tax=Streptomyces sp. NBC_01142 TaxID=2975865 RepID=UPI00224D49FC|nr:hypothetical protein [Streptomyces sp. NBC_01142]MCX4818685.1 hypothetical protein [Streptomyces sp. NBC_01142]